jgi:hypothetical protein
MNASRMIRWAVVVLLVGLGAAPARGEMIFEGMGLSEAVKINAPGVHISTSAGQLMVEYEGIDYAGYCVDIYHSAGDMSVTERGIDSLPNSEQIAYLYETYADNVTTGLAAAALQVTFWEVINESGGNGFDAGAGSFYITRNSDVRNLANDMLSGLPTSYQPTYDFMVLHNDRKQDILVASVPEPTTMALLAAGGTLTLIRRRRTK